MRIRRKFETIEISDIDQDVIWRDVTPEDQYDGGWHINFIQWVTPGANDVMYIQNGSGLNDPVIYYNRIASQNADLPRYFYGARVQFFIDYICRFVHTN